MNPTITEAIDPICGMTVDTATARHAAHDGKTFYFCSEQCRVKFLAAPADAKPEGKSGGKSDGKSGGCCCG